MNTQLADFGFSTRSGLTKIRVLVAVIIATLLLAGPVPMVSAEEDTITVTGTVVSGGVPVEGIDVQLGNATSTTTNEDGEFSAQFDKDSEILVVVGAAQNLAAFPYYTWERTFDKSSGNVDVGTISLTPTGAANQVLKLNFSNIENPDSSETFTGKVTLEANPPETDFLDRSENAYEFLKFEETVTDALSVTFTGIPAIRYELTTEMEGFESRFQRFVLAPSDDPTERLVRIRPSAPEPTGDEILEVILTTRDGELGSCFEVVITGPVQKFGLLEGCDRNRERDRESDANVARVVNSATDGFVYTYTFSNLPAGIYSFSGGDFSPGATGGYSNLASRERRVVVTEKRDNNGVVPNEHRVSIRVLNEDKTRTVSGQFPVAAGVPGSVFNGLSVAFEAEDSDIPTFFEPAEINEDGSFTFESVPFGRYLLDVNQDDGPPWIIDPQTVEVTVGPFDGDGAAPPFIISGLPTIEIEPVIASRVLEVVIQDRVNHRPISNVEVRLDHRGSRFRATAETTLQDGQIFARFVGLPEGEFFVGSDTESVFIPPQTVIDGDRGRVRVRADQVSYDVTVRGRLLDPFGDPAEGSVAVVVLLPRGKDLAPVGAMTESEGEFEATNWPSGYQLELEIRPFSDAAGLTSMTTVVGPFEAGSNVDLGDFILPFGATVSGSVEGGVPGALYAVEAYTVDGTFLDSALVEGDGYFEIEQLPLGPVQLGVLEFGLSPLQRPFFIGVDNGIATATNDFGNAQPVVLSRAGLDLGVIDLTDAIATPVRNVVGEIRVQVGGVDSSESIPLPRSRGVRVELLDRTTGEPTLYDVFTFPTVNGSEAGGAFTLPSVPEGEYVLRFTDPTRNENRGLDTVQIDLAVPAIGLSGDASEEALSLDIGEIVMSAIVPTIEIEPVVLDNVDGVSAFEDFVSLENTPTVGGLVTLDVGEDLAGEWVLVVANSDPEVISGGWVRVTSEGKVSATIPATLPTNIAHRLAIQDADLALTGWTRLNLGPGGSSPSGPASSPKQRKSITLTESDEATFSSPFLPRRGSLTEAIEQGPASEQPTEPLNELPSSPESVEEESPSIESAEIVASGDNPGNSTLWLWLVGGVLGLSAIVTVVLLARRASTI